MYFLLRKRVSALSAVLSSEDGDNRIPSLTKKRQKKTPHIPEKRPLSFFNPLHSRCFAPYRLPALSGL